MENKKSHPKIIQGGMGVWISTWKLARTVSLLGQLGTISGVALEKIMARTLQRGDPGGHIRRALATFPDQDAANKIINSYFVSGGIGPEQKFKSVPVFTVKPSRDLIAMTVCSNYAFVWLAKEGHNCPVNINYMEKISMSHVYSIAGAMLAGVDYITIGAGIPMGIPAVITSLHNNETAAYTIEVDGSKEKIQSKFSLSEFIGGAVCLKKPKFLPIIASNLLAKMLVKKLPLGSIEGFVVEEWTAGGHNAPPRDAKYGPKDYVNYEELSELGMPFWIGGSYASNQKLSFALSLGARGIQAGTIFALCEESGMDPSVKRLLRRLGFNDLLQVETNMKASPTGFPFKVASLPGTLSQKEVYNSRERCCDQCGLVKLYLKSNGEIGYRCSAEPIETYISKGGNKEDTEDKICLCNGLISTAGLGNPGEPAVVTLGDDVSFLRQLMQNEDGYYFAKDAIEYLLNTSSLA